MMVYYEQAGQESIWKNRTFVRFFTAFGLSCFGDWLDLVALTEIMCYRWNVSPLMVSLYAFTFCLPSILFSQFGGVLADVVNKRKLMMLSDLIRSFLTLGLLLAPGPWWVLALQTLRGTASVFHGPAQSALMRTMVRDDQLLQANGLNGTVSQVGKVFGPILGAAIISVASPYICIILNACSFLASFFLLWSAGKMEERSIQNVQTRTEKQSIWKLWSEGYRLFLNNRRLLVATLLLVLVVMLVQFSDTLWAVHLRVVLPGHPEWFGWMIACIGLGAIPSTLKMTRQKEIRSYAVTIGGGIFLIGLGYGGVGVYESGWNPYLLLIFSIVIGLGNGILFPCVSYLIQKESTTESVGRINGIVNSLTNFVILFAPLLGGALATSKGAGTVFTISGSLTFGLSLLVLISGKRLLEVRMERKEFFIKKYLN